MKNSTIISGTTQYKALYVGSYVTSCIIEYRVRHLNLINGNIE